MVAEEAASQRTVLAEGNEGDWALVMEAFELMLVKFLVCRNSMRSIKKDEDEVKTKQDFESFLLTLLSLNKGNHNHDSV